MNHTGSVPEVPVEWFYYMNIILATIGLREAQGVNGKIEGKGNLSEGAQDDKGVRESNNNIFKMSSRYLNSTTYLTGTMKNGNKEMYI